MPESTRVLVVGSNAQTAEQARLCLADRRPPVTVQWLKDAAMAVARVGGGDIDVLVVDPALVGATAEFLRAWLQRARESCPHTQVLVLSESRDWTADLRRMVDSGPARASARRRAKWIGLLGAKGGVGTTTVALNAACVLSETRAVILADVGAGNDMLTLRVRPTARWAGPAGGALGHLWSVKSIPGLRIAMAQDTADVEALTAELEEAGREADYVVLDLGSPLTALVRHIVPRLDVLGTMVDMEMLSGECARRVLATLAQAEAAPRGSTGVVVVNRASLAWPLTVDELERLVGMPVLGTIPPAADLCSNAQKARRPVVSFDAESLAAQSLVQTSVALAELA